MTALNPDDPADDRRLLALHEAGHGLAALVAGCRVELVRIDPAPGRGGHCRARPPANLPRAVEVGRHLAGAAAEVVALGYNALSWPEVERRCGTARTDFGRARRVAGDDEVMLAAAWAETLRLITARWAGVAALAAGLLEQGTLSGEAARRIVRAAMPPSPSARRVFGY